MKEYNKENIPLAKTLRKNMTPWERKLWHCFLKTYPVRFQRQKCIDNYIVDFYCHGAKLAVELDGSQHYETEGKQADEKRDLFLKSLGITVLRYSNLDVNRKFAAVCEDILHHLNCE